MQDSAIDEKTVLAKIRAELGQHLREHGAPEDVSGFLTAHWARLMAAIYVAKGNRHADWLAGWDTVNALLWTLSPRSGRQETETMLRVLPTLLARLHEGCVALGLPAPERDALFEQLAQMHAAIAREGLKYPAAENKAGLATGLDSDPVADLANLKPPKLEAGSGDATPELPPLKTGSRIMLTLHGEERPMVLNWISPVGGMYMFTNEHGLDALTFTRARLVERFRGGQARLL